MKNKFLTNFKKYFHNILEVSQVNIAKTFKPAYRVVNIEQEKNGDYRVTLQIIGKNNIFKVKPEYILANDKMVDLLSPKDVRTLTYLGYLDINSPQYRILAKRLSQKDNKMLFALNKKGEEKFEIKTAHEIAQNKKILNKLDWKDIHMIGYTEGTEEMLDEQKEKERIHKKLNNKN